MTENSQQHIQQLSKRSLGAIAGTLLSRISGIFRTVIINAVFGANIALDAFNAAFRFPNSLRDLFADGALSAAFIKVLVDVEPEGVIAQRNFISIVIGFFIVVTVLIAGIAAYYAEPFMRLITDNKFQQAGGVTLAAMQFRLLAFYLPITMLNAVAMAILGVHGQTFRAMNGTIFLSLGMIIGAVCFAPLAQHWQLPPILGLAWGAMCGVIIQFIYQILPAWHLQLLTWPNFNCRTWFHYQPLRQVLWLMAPRAMGQGAMVIALAINTFFATKIGAGALTYVATAIIIIQVPIGLFGVATGFAALPILTQALNNNALTKFATLLTESLRTTTWLALFANMALSLLIVPVYLIIFQHGKITFHDNLQNSIAICAYGMGIVFAAGDKVLINALYAINATRQIVYNAFIYLIVNAALSSWLAPKLGLLGLGISFSCATAIDFSLNYFVIKYHIARRFNQFQVFAQRKNFTVKIFSSGLWAFVNGLIGVDLIHLFWPKIFSYFSHTFS